MDNTDSVPQGDALGWANGWAFSPHHQCQEILPHPMPRVKERIVAIGRWSVWRAGLPAMLFVVPTWWPSTPVKHIFLPHLDRREPVCLTLSWKRRTPRPAVAASGGLRIPRMPKIAIP